MAKTGHRTCPIPKSKGGGTHSSAFHHPESLSFFLFLLSVTSSKLAFLFAYGSHCLRIYSAFWSEALPLSGRRGIFPFILRFMSSEYFLNCSSVRMPFKPSLYAFMDSSIF